MHFQHGAFQGSGESEGEFSETAHPIWVCAAEEAEGMFLPVLPGLLGRTAEAGWNPVCGRRAVRRGKAIGFAFSIRFFRDFLHPPCTLRSVLLQ